MITWTKGRQMIREWIEQLDFGRLLLEVRRATALPEERVQDALLDIVSMLLLRTEKYKESFSEEASFVAYVRKSATRHAIQKYVRETQRSWEQEWIPDDASTPEEQLLDALGKQDASAWLEHTLSHEQNTLTSNAQNDLRQLVQHVLKQPEEYIQKRRSGEQRGQYVFQYTKLAETLDWSRKQLYKRMNQLRSLLLEYASQNELEVHVTDIRVQEP